MSNIESVNNENFGEKVLKSEKATLVDFWAEWCGPCKALGPILDEVADELKNDAQVVKVNVDDNSELAQKYSIRGIPTMIFFKDGEVKNTLVGNQPKADILKSLKELI